MNLLHWFDVTSTEKPKEIRCTYTDRYGNTTSIDESYEQLKRQSN